MWIERVPHHLTPKGVLKVERDFNAKFMGMWATRKTLSNGEWYDTPVDVFYQPKPREGHTNYFGIFDRDGRTMICNAVSAFESPITGVLGPDDEVVVSRYRHDYQERYFDDGNYVMIDGGRDYIRAAAGNQPMVSVRVLNGVFHFEVPPTRALTPETPRPE